MPPPSLVEVSSTSARWPGLIDEIDLHIAPILLGDGIRLYDSPGDNPIRLQRVGDGETTSAVNVRYRPIRTANIAPGRVSE